MKIKTRLYGAFLIVAILVAFVGGINLLMSERRDVMVNRSNEIENIQQALISAVAAHNIWVKNVYAFFVNKTDKLEVQIDSTKCQFGQFLYGDGLRHMSILFPSIVSILERVKDPHTRIHNGAAAINRLWQLNNEESHNRALAVLESDINQALKEVTQILDEAQNEALQLDHQIVADMATNIAFAKKATWSAIVVAFLCTAFLGFKISRGISIPLKKASDLAEKIGCGDISSERLNLELNDEIGQMAQAMDKMADALETKSRLAESVADGDLTVEVELVSSRDILGISLRTMVESLSQFLGQVSEAATQVETSSSQISDASQALSQGATESSASLEEISSSITDINCQTRANADNAAQANQLATQTRAAAESGNSKMADMMKAMDEIQQSSKGIAKIIKVIDDIAFQTNLLALNAAVEAARAGRQGKGFAVVAEEVRNLAGRSARAARETADMIAHSISKVEAGTQLAKVTEDALAGIKDSSVKVADLVGEIAAASREQAVKIEQIGQGLGQIDIVTQQNSASSEETAAAAADLLFQAKELSGLLRQFHLHDSKNRQSRTRSAQEQRPAKASAESTLPAKNTTRKNLVPPRSAAAKPSNIIALDDDEFGRY
ncbi:MAG: hypothetical protein A2W80_16835 [Candidatus Riflebacteria bacterium GWC2_50_8]|nr:MAG: hypothetical protein A2W80_16835 [Candidatus Riflebacteria bacterium GWC2_50_8]